jgi:hypothetical protein
MGESRESDRDITDKGKEARRYGMRYEDMKEIISLRLNPEILSWFISVQPRKCQDRSMKYIVAALFHIPSKSL